jgi:uncharacterized protein YjbI with pentapeptide repeats
MKLIIMSGLLVMAFLSGTFIHVLLPGLGHNSVQAAKPLSPSGLTTPLITNVSLRNVKMAGADFTVSGLNGEIVGSQLASIVSSDLHGADLRNVSVLDASAIVDSNLSEVNLSGAYLRNTVFTNTNLAGALGGTSANTTGVTWQNVVCPDGSNSDAVGTTCVGHGF